MTLVIIRVIIARISKDAELRGLAEPSSAAYKRTQLADLRPREQQKTWVGLRPSALFDQLSAALADGGAVFCPVFLV